MKYEDQDEGTRDFDIVVFPDHETWSSIEGCLVRVDGKVYDLGSILSYIPFLQEWSLDSKGKNTILNPEPLTIYIDECTNEAVVENPNVTKS